MELIIIFLIGLIAGVVIQKKYGIQKLGKTLWQNIDKHIISKFEK